MQPIVQEFKTPSGITSDKKSRDRFVIFPDTVSLAQYADETCKLGRDQSRSFTGGDSWGDSVRKATAGDLSMVAKSDAMLDKFEALLIPTARTVLSDNVVGAVPNVPAFIAGHPMNMRTKRKVATEQAPLAVIVDLVSSGGIGARDLERRGIALLALVRALSAKRPVELWISCGLHASCGAVYVTAQIQTAPLDLAHVAPVLCTAGYTRNLVYGIGSSHHGFNGSWPYSAGAKHRDYMQEIMRPAFPHVGELLCIPAPFLHDPLIENPEQWLADQIATHIKTDITDSEEG